MRTVMTDKELTKSLISNRIGSIIFQTPANLTQGLYDYRWVDVIYKRINGLYIVEVKHNHNTIEYVGYHYSFEPLPLFSKPTNYTELGDLDVEVKYE